MERLSKEDRKRMRRQAEEALRQAQFHCWVVSEKATASVASPEAIVEETKKVGVNLGCRQVDAETHAFFIPSGPEQLVVFLRYDLVDERLLGSISEYEWSVRDRSSLRLGLPMILFGGQMNLDPAIDFLGMTIKRVLGRMVGGVLISDGNRFVMDDWLSWSLDYMDPDMFKITRLYDNPPPNFQQLLDRFPRLRWQAGHTAKPWWKFW